MKIISLGFVSDLNCCKMFLNLQIIEVHRKTDDYNQDRGCLNCEANRSLQFLTSVIKYQLISDNLLYLNRKCVCVYIQILIGMAKLLVNSRRNCFFISMDKFTY